MIEKERRSQNKGLSAYEQALKPALSQSENLISRAGLIRRLRKGRDLRSKFLESHLNKKLALQIRSLRGDLSQEQMEQKVGIKQQALSRLENPYYGKVTLSTLKKIAAACDVALIVEFVPFSQLINRVSGTPYVEHGFGPGTFNLADFEQEEAEGKFREGEFLDATTASDEHHLKKQHFNALVGTSSQQLNPGKKKPPAPHAAKGPALHPRRKIRSDELSD
jgi:transcriptional regulator with XRE-family HTH domain